MSFADPSPPRWELATGQANFTDKENSLALILTYAIYETGYESVRLSFFSSQNFFLLTGTE